jgi:capsular polysaccharide transport system permease protein
MVARSINKLDRIFSRQGFRLVVLLPVLLAAVYFFLFAHKQYQAESQILIKQYSTMQDSGLGLGLGQLLGISNTSREDGYIAIDYILSPNMLQQLEDALQLRAHFSAPRRDFLKRLSPDASFESFLKYYRKQVTVAQDPMSGIITVEARAFSPEMAAAINRTILEFTEDAINRLSKDLNTVQLDYAESELSRTEAQVLEKRRNIMAFQQQNVMLDPTAEGLSRAQVVANLQGEIIRREADLKIAESYMQPEAYQVVALQRELDALRRQAEQESLKLTATEREGLNVTMLDFEELKMRLEFALNTYKSALVMLESTRLEASRQMKFVITIASTTLPEEEVFPRIGLGLLTVLVVALLVFGVLKLIIATIKDHAL